MLTFADLTSNKRVSEKEFHQIENRMHIEVWKRVDKLPFIDLYSAEFQFSKENEKYYRRFVTLPILNRLTELNFPIKNIVKYKGKCLDDIEYKETFYLDGVKKFRKTQQDVPTLVTDQTFVIVNNTLKQASLL